MLLGAGEGKLLAVVRGEVDMKLGYLSSSRLGDC